MKNIIYFFLFLLPLAGSGQLPVPYAENFDSGNSPGWTHYALYGTDEWQLGTPSGQYFNAAHSTPNAWVTDLYGTHATNSAMCLQTPAFDLSAPVNYCLSFRNSSRMPTGTTGVVQYSTDGGATWNKLNSTDPYKTKLWYSNPGSYYSGFTGYFSGSSAHSLEFLQGQPNVTFRFVLTSESYADEGWMIDNFSIDTEFHNVRAVQGDTIKDFSQNMPTFKVITDLLYDNQYSGTFNNTTEYFLSRDSILDAEDSLLATATSSPYGYHHNFSKIINTPQGLGHGKYFILFKHDALNVLPESNENDNAHYAVLLVDSTFSTGVDEDFEGKNYWRTFAYYTQYGSAYNPVFWEKGEGNRHRIEGTHSGKQAWHTGNRTDNIATHVLQSPFIDFRSSQDNVLSFWYKMSNEYYTVYNAYVKLNPSYSITNEPVKTIPMNRNAAWDFFTIRIPQLDSTGYSKFSICLNTVVNYVNITYGLIVDDVYWGPAKPDLSIEGNKLNRNTKSTAATDSLKYYLVNSGLSAAASTVTQFYWSTDSVLDGADVLLGSAAEPSMLDTSSALRYFTYTKPVSTPGKYFILYMLDTGNLLDEMRETNNSGYFEIHQSAPASVPYYNDFETSGSDWRTSSSLGNNSWKLTTPGGTVLDSAISGTMAWVTDSFYSHSRSHLYSPVFDLSAMSDPVVEFDLKNTTYGGSMIYETAAGNMSYSIDGGATWMLLKPVNNSFTGMYGSSGSMLYTPLMEAVYENIFVQNTSPYNNQQVEHMVDVPFLAGMSNVQFRFNAANEDGAFEGLLMDNFSIKPRKPEIDVTYSKTLMSSSKARYVKFFMKISNTGNYITSPGTVLYYLSADTVIDASDKQIGSFALPALPPLGATVVNQQYLAPSSLGSYNYLLYKLDATNTTTEADEAGNESYWPFAVDSVFNYPYTENFNNTVIDGWHQYALEAYSGNIINGFTLASKGLAWTKTPYQYYSGVNQVPIKYLESPPFNFRGMDHITLSFDFTCSGTGGYSTLADGGSMDYSLDGGNTWISLASTYASQAQNWFTHKLDGLGGMWGWSGYLDTFRTATYDASFLRGQEHVMFRYMYRSYWYYTSDGYQGFQVDNFRVNALPVDYAVDSSLTVVNAYIAQPSFSVSYSIENLGLGEGKPTVTNFWWSTDSIFDSSDKLLYSYSESKIAPGTVLTAMRNIYYPVPVERLHYYLIYKADAENKVLERNEANNTGYYKVIFDTLSTPPPPPPPNGIADSNGSNFNLYWYNSSIIVEHAGALTGGTHIELRDALGRLIASHYDAVNSRVVWQVDDLSAGMYFVVVSSGNERKLLKVISQR